MRVWYELSHVLLKPEYELKVSNFFYPYQPEALLTKDKPPMASTLSPDADDIVSLTEFPVIRLSSHVNMARFNNPKLQKFYKLLMMGKMGLWHP